MKVEKELRNIKGFFKGKQKRLIQQGIENYKKILTAAKEIYKK